MGDCHTDPDCPYEKECREFIESLPSMNADLRFEVYIIDLIDAVWHNHHPGALCKED